MVDPLLIYKYDDTYQLSHILIFTGNIYSKDLYRFKDFLNYLHANAILFEGTHHIPTTELYSIIVNKIYFESKADAMRAFLMWYDDKNYQN